MKIPIDELRATLRSLYPEVALPVSLTLNFLNIPQRGSVLTTSLKVVTSRVELEPGGATRAANIDIAGLILDIQGKVVSSFENRLTIKINSTDVKSSPPDSVSYNHLAAIKPGLYQVRVALRERSSGHTGGGRGTARHDRYKGSGRSPRAATPVAYAVITSAASERRQPGPRRPVAGR